MWLFIWYGCMYDFRNGFLLGGGLCFVFFNGLYDLMVGLDRILILIFVWGFGDGCLGVV